MDARRFDALARATGAATTRRQVLKAIVGVMAGGMLARFGRGDSAGARAPQPRAVPALSTFQRTWERTDKPVAEGRAVRTWMWGPSPFTDGLQEDYAEAPGGKRTVQYYDKSRMEDNTFRTTEAPWDVTNGLLSKELITGQKQVGDGSYVPLQPAQVNVAGDPDDPDGPTYASFSGLLTAPALAEGTTITQRVNRAGVVTNDPGLASRGITAGHYVPETQHTVATPFWNFMSSSGVVYENGAYVNAPLFVNPYYATGFPVTEAYFAAVRVGGTLKDVLMQCFERRCLTFTQDNPPEWQTEMGNVGQHYHNWAYPSAADLALVSAPPTITGALINAAEQTPEYQALTGYVEGEGYQPVAQIGVQAVESGSATGSVLISTHQENTANPGQAHVIFDGTAGPAGQVYAVVQNGSGTSTQVVSVGAGGQLVASFPVAPSGSGAAGLAAQRAVATARGISSAASSETCAEQYQGNRCGECVCSCEAANANYDPDDPIASVDCVAATWLACLHGGAPDDEVGQCIATGIAFCAVGIGVNCDGVCRHACTQGCGNCMQSSDPANLCCDNRCTDTRADGNHCGACGHFCGPGEACCNGSCVNVSENESNCGTCGNACGSGATCVNGTCRGGCNPSCGASQLCCGTTCVNYLTDPDNCGDCGNTCLSTEFCSNGNCIECDASHACPSCQECQNGRCFDCSTYCCSNGSCAPDGTCCPGDYACATGACCPPDYQHCCQDGGCCATGYPVCCPEFCCSSGYSYCCDDGCCPDGYPLCPPSGWESCCPSGAHHCVFDGIYEDYCCPGGSTCVGSGECEQNKIIADGLGGVTVKKVVSNGIGAPANAPGDRTLSN